MEEQCDVYWMEHGLGTRAGIRNPAPLVLCPWAVLNLPVSNELLGELNELMSVKHLAWCLAQSKHSGSLRRKEPYQLLKPCVYHFTYIFLINSRGITCYSPYFYR